MKLKPSTHSASARAPVLVRTGFPTLTGGDLLEVEAVGGVGAGGTGAGGDSAVGAEGGAAGTAPLTAPSAARPASPGDRPAPAVRFDVFSPAAGEAKQQTSR